MSVPDNTPDSTLRQRPAATATAATSTTPKDNNASGKKAVVASAEFAKTWEKPPMSLKEVHAVVPKHCFKRDTLTSFGYLFRDIAMMLALFTAATYIDSFPTLSYILWPAYWIAQGIVCTGIWVIAHECGHQAFSDKAWINNATGYVMHTFLLVPYFSWKHSHSKHHKANAHMNKDQVFVPATRSKYIDQVGPSVHIHDDEPALHAAPIYDLLNIFGMLTFGWPLYLLKNVSGQKFDTWTSHYRPDAPIFEPKQWFSVVLSDMGIVVMLAILGAAAHTFGPLAVVKYYLIPYLNVNAWLVLITFLQHTDPRIPHYREGEWNFFLGAIATVDRDFGILNWFFHGISNTHVAHHLFSTMPHYNAEEATKAIEQKLGKYYIMDRTPIAKALWQCYRHCKFVEDEGDIVWYKH
ncbi:fatty acid desaturase-domain-containing protein [Phlyctochytrium arcticum]|nr:fatty acid desaturase-domain-containing protein [Phlyctochytrium arcticum]